LKNATNGIEANWPSGASQNGDIFWHKAKSQQPFVVNFDEQGADTLLGGIVAGLDEPAYKAGTSGWRPHWYRSHGVWRELAAHNHHLSGSALRSPPCPPGAATSLRSL
jgi:hypothetical protein